ncbi:impact family protein [Zalerion maritima]|uniref:Impact family protein n=1 Tax=Zalerion maritima TaxID=339359 RepID=A0AAD5RWA3_9PEZI|nr:impact family protein [Zalerion maritima]
MPPPPQDLLDEIEAINSIYEEDTLTAFSCTANPSREDTATSLLLLKLPTSTILRLSFPSSYPSAPPAVLAVHASAGVKGTGARDLETFRGAVGNVYEAGGVCVFDAVEEFNRLHAGAQEAGAKAQAQGSGSAAAGGGGGEDGPRGSDGELLDAEDKDDDHDDDHDHDHDAGYEEGTGGAGAGKKCPVDDDQRILACPPPPWAATPPLAEQKSTFVGRAAVASSPRQAGDYLRHLVLTDRKVRDATHNISAWRISGRGAPGEQSSSPTQDYDDDGETAAGGRLLRLLQLMDVWDVVVVVSRWYGGVKLGPKRFAIINAVGRDAVVLAGLGGEKGGGGGGRGKGRKKK